MSVTWADRTEIKSSSSSRVYVVSQQVLDGVPTGYWACTCPGGKTANKRGVPCRHLKTMGLPMIPPHAPVTKPASAEATREGFSDDAYRHYNPWVEGFGSAEDWLRAAEALAAGRGKYKKPARPAKTWFTQDDDLELLGLSAMPVDIKGLVKAMRKRAMRLHPDHGGDPEEFKAMFAAYERLTKSY